VPAFDDDGLEGCIHMRKKNPAIRFDQNCRDFPEHSDPLVDMDPTAPITHARFGFSPSTLVSVDESIVADPSSVRRQPRNPDFEKKVRRLLKHGRP